MLKAVNTTDPLTSLKHAGIIDLQRSVEIRVHRTENVDLLTGLQGNQSMQNGLI